MTATQGPTDSGGTPAVPTNGNGRGWTYLLLLTMQTFGATVIYWIGIPVYQRINANPGAPVGGEEMLVWSSSAVVLMQTAYWIRHRVVPMPPQVRPNALFGHVVLFVAHLAFDVAVVVFVFAFVFRPPEFQLPVLRYSITMAAIFALFCYSLELERFGKAFLCQKKKTAQKAE